MAVPPHNHHGHPPSVNVELPPLPRIVLQDALSEVVKVCLSLKLKVFVGDITAFAEGRNKELERIADNVLNQKKKKRAGRERPGVVDHGWRKTREEQGDRVV